MFKVNNKDTRTTTMMSLSSVSIINFEQVNISWVVTATLPITEKPSVTFTSERLNTWGSQILQENVLKIFSSLQYLTIY